MQQPLTAHSFVIRVWTEETSATGGPTLRGHVTHVIDRNRRYVESLDALVEFIAGYLFDDTPGTDESPPG